MFAKREIVANGHGALSPIYFAIHSTANVGASARNHVNYWRDNPQGNKYAVHYVADWNEAFQCVEEDRLCYQVGNGNSKCIGIEICEGRNEDEFMRSMENARKVILEVLARRGWGIDKLKSHDWFRIHYGGTDHTDPLPYLKRYGKDWDWFINFISQGESAPQIQPTEFEEEIMEYIMQPDEQNYLVHVCGMQYKVLTHPDQVVALQETARRVKGKELPIFAYGNKVSPWGGRLLEALEEVK